MGNHGAVGGISERWRSSFEMALIMSPIRFETHNALPGNDIRPIQ